MLNAGTEQLERNPRLADIFKISMSLASIQADCLHLTDKISASLLPPMPKAEEAAKSSSMQKGSLAELYLSLRLILNMASETKANLQVLDESLSDRDESNKPSLSQIGR